MRNVVQSYQIWVNLIWFRGMCMHKIKLYQRPPIRDAKAWRILGQEQNELN